MEEIKRQSGVFFDDPEIEESPDELDSATDNEDRETGRSADVAPLGNGTVRRKVKRRFDGAGSSSRGKGIEEDDVIQQLGLGDEEEDDISRGRDGTFVG
jgi:hypothetical protein